MAISIRNRDGERSIPASPGNIVARIGVAAGGTANEVYAFDPGQERQVPDVISYGPLTTATSRALVQEAAQRCLAVKAEASITGSISSVTQNGSGPLLVAAAEALPSAGPWADLDVLVTITTGGPLGDAKANVAIDGVTTAYAIDIEAEKPAMLRGTVDLSALDGAGLAAFNSKLFSLADVDGASPTGITFSGVTSVNDIVSQVDAITGIAASLVGGRFLQIVGAAVGNAGSLEVGTDNANALLGFTNGQQAVGTESTFSIPGAGVSMQFPSGTYAKSTTYAFTTTAPRMTLSDFEAAMTALRESGEPFGLVVPVQAAVDGVDLSAWQAQLELIVGGWHQAAENPIYPAWLLGSPLGETGDDGIQANDEDVRDELAGTTALYGAIVHGDLYYSTLEYAGRHRYSAVLKAAERCATRRLSEDLGFGGAGDLEDVFLRAPDGTKIRTEGRAVVKMADRGFVVLKDEGGAPRFVRGRTRYAEGSNFVSFGVLRATFEADRIVRTLLAEQEQSDPPTGADGQLTLAANEGLKSGFDAALKTGLVDEAHFSSAFTKTITLLPDGGADKMKVEYALQRKAQIKNIEADLVIVRTIGATG